VRLVVQGDSCKGVALMLNQYKQIGRDHVRIRDCYVWAEISYLDSTTNYREYLPRRQTHPPVGLTHELVVLDVPMRWWNSNQRPCEGWKIPGFFFIIAGLLLGLLLYMWS
jgi:hypothetical protein